MPNGLIFLCSRCQWPLWGLESHSFGVSGGKWLSLRWNFIQNFIYILYYINDIILVFQVKITIITVTFGVTTPSVATTPTAVVTRAPRGINYYLIKCRSNSITAIMRKGWFSVLCFDNAGFNSQPPRCRSQADAAKPYEASCSHWQWSNSVTLFVVSVFRATL